MHNNVGDIKALILQATYCVDILILIAMCDQLEGSRKKGRPKLRWLDDVLEDLKILKVTAWWKKAQESDSWKTVIKEAKAHKGL
jgi:hypothetical protein